MKFKILISLLLELCCSLSHSQNISGYIQDSEGVALPFANILVENTEIGTTSDKDGYFQINFEVIPRHLEHYLKPVHNII